MKNEILKFSAMLLLLTFMIAAFPTEEDYKVYNDTLRLHILANSDSREDQDIKIAVRDLVLKNFGGELDEADEINSAIKITESVISDIESAVNGYLRELGVGYTGEAKISREWYETRDYEGFTLPRGYYSSLVIRLGTGEGQNWWCIMFPPLCCDLASEGGGDENEKTYDIGGEKYNIKFKALEILSDLFKKKG